jgi:hypothetical protein
LWPMRYNIIPFKYAFYDHSTRRACVSGESSTR